MPLSQPLTGFGLHGATIIDRTTNEFAGMLKIISESNPDLGQETISLQGGSSPYPWDSAPGYATGELAITLKQYDLQALKYFGGVNTVSANYTEDSDGEASGYASALENVVGTSVFNATTGLASVAITTLASARFGEYLIKATADDDFDVYLDNDLDGDIFINDLLKITNSPLAIGDTSATVAIPNTGLTITGGSGTVNMTPGDIARFNIRPANDYFAEYKGGGSGTSLPEFGLKIYLEKQGDKYRELYLPRVRSSGIKPSHSEKEFSTLESTLTVLFDSVKGYAYRYQWVGR